MIDDSFSQRKRMTNSERGDKMRLKARTHLLSVEDKLLLQLGEQVACIEPFGKLEKTFVDVISRGTTIAELFTTFHHLADVETCERMTSWLEQLYHLGFMENTSLQNTLCDEDADRFARLLDYLSEHETAGITRFDLLKRVRESRVAIMGVGGLGSWVIYNLISLGIGILRLIDCDLVEVSNLNRSILFSEADVGRPKVEAAEQSIRRYAPRTELEINCSEVDGVQSVERFVSGMDFLICVADKPQGFIHRWVAQGCHAAGVPYIIGRGFRVGPLCEPGVTPCAICDEEASIGSSDAVRRALLNSASLPKGSSGAISPVASITAGVLARDVFFHLTSIRKPVSRAAIWQMAADGTAQVRDLVRHSRCSICNH